MESGFASESHCPLGHACAHRLYVTIGLIEFELRDSLLHCDTVDLLHIDALLLLIYIVYGRCIYTLLDWCLLITRLLLTRFRHTAYLLIHSCRR